MGEYAIRKKDGERIKIGTCSDMYYIRYEDRHKVSPLLGNVDILAHPEDKRFRLPFPDEDSLEPGQYDQYNRSLRLGGNFEGTAEMCGSIGNIQLRHENSGLLLNVPCYHGIKLPEVGPNMSAFWNGKGYSLVLSSLRVVAEGGEYRVYPVIRCRHCGEAWRAAWDDVMDFIEPAMQERLAIYATEAP